MLHVAKNIFDLSGPSRPFNYIQQSRNADNICKEIKQHLISIGSSKPHELSQILTNEYIGLKSPASQNMMDVYHQSGYQSFDEFVNNTSLSRLRKDNPQIFNQYKQYQLIYNNEICRPLSDYNPSENAKFTNNLSETLNQLSLAFCDCKQREIATDSCTQMDLFFSVQSTDNNDDNDEDEDSDDEDEEYDVNLRKYNQNIQQSLNFPARSSANYHNRFNEQRSESKYSDFVENELDEGLNHIMRIQFRRLTKRPFTYRRNEILIDNYDKYIVKTLTTNDTIPALSFENTPLFRHYNTINGIKSMVKYLNHQSVKLLVFSFHILHDCMQLFCYIYDNGVIYGSRIFTKDLFETIPRFYKCSTIEDLDKEQILKNMKITNNLKFDDDKIYKEYHGVLTSKKASNDHQINKELCDKLEKFVEIWNINNNFNNPLDLHELIKMFVANKIDYEWFKNDFNQTKFVSILIKNKYCIPLISALWKHLTVNEYKIKENENVNELQEKHELLQQQRQIKQLTALVTRQQQTIYEQSQKIQQLKDSSNGTTSSSSNGNPNGPAVQLPDIPLSPLNSVSTLSFNGWNSGCNGCGVSDQTSDEDNAEINYTDTTDCNLNHLPISPMNIAAALLFAGCYGDDAVNDLIHNTDGKDQVIPNLSDEQQINNNIVTCNPTGSDQQRQSQPSSTYNGNNQNGNCNNGNHQNNNNNHNHNNNNYNNNNNNNGNNNNGGPNGNFNLSFLSPYQIENCPFCAASNISFRLYLIHCSLDHPLSNHNMHAAVHFWNQHNKALFRKEQSTFTPNMQPQASNTPQIKEEQKQESPSSHQQSAHKQQKKAKKNKKKKANKNKKRKKITIIN